MFSGSMGKDESSGGSSIRDWSTSVRDWEWKRLLPELRVKILHLLPLRSAAVSRGVCREWKQCLSGWSSLGRPWFLIRHEQVEQEGSLKWSLVDAGTGEWIRLQGIARFATSAAAGDGIVCVCVGNSVRPEFYVGNPLLGSSSWQKLPELPPLKTSALARLVLSTSLLTSVLGIVSSSRGKGKGKEENRGFQVLVGRCGYILVYSSGSSKWEEVPGEPPSLALQLLQETDERGIVPVKRKNQLIWAPLRAGGGIVGFDFSSCTWFVREPAVFERLSAASLTRTPGSGGLLLLGAHRSSGSHHFRHLKVWELGDDETEAVAEAEPESCAEWKCSSRMKDYMLQEISPKGFFAVHCCGEDELLLLTCTLEKFSSQLRDWGFKRLVVWSYDRRNSRWSSNPLRRPLQDVEMSSVVVYPFQPSLAG